MILSMPSSMHSSNRKGILQCRLQCVLHSWLGIVFIHSDSQTVFLVGGLSTNNWFWSQLESYFSARKMGIHRLDNHWCVITYPGNLLPHAFCSNKVVAEGAVLYAATKRSVDAHSACAFTDSFNKFSSRKEPSLATPRPSSLSCSRIIRRDHLGVACATRSAISALPVRVINKEHSGGRTTLRDSLSRVFSR